MSRHTLVSIFSFLRFFYQYNPHPSKEVSISSDYCLYTEVALRIFSFILQQVIISSKVYREIVSWTKQMKQELKLIMITKN